MNKRRLDSLVACYIAVRCGQYTVVAIQPKNVVAFSEVLSIMYTLCCGVGCIFFCRFVGFSYAPLSMNQDLKKQNQICISIITMNVKNKRKTTLEHCTTATLSQRSYEYEIRKYLYKYRNRTNLIKVGLTCKYMTYLAIVKELECIIGIV